MIIQNFTEINDFLISVFGASSFGIIVIDLDGEISMVNETAVKLLNIQIAINDVVDTNIFEYLEELNDLRDQLQSCLKKGRKAFHISETSLGGKCLSIKVQPILNGQTINIEDISERVAARQAAFNAILEGQENERQRLASEIHDGLGPMLSTIRLKTEALKENFTTEGAKLLQEISQIVGLIDTITDDTRNISHALSPSSLKKLGLVASLHSLCENANEHSKSNIQFMSNGKKPSKKLAEQAKLNIYRVGQELLNDALKYSQAENINLQLTFHKDELLLTIEDDGIGFDKKKLQEKNGIGLMNIESRTKVLGGTFEVDSQPDHGVSASIYIPLSKETD